VPQGSSAAVEQAAALAATMKKKSESTRSAVDIAMVGEVDDWEAEAIKEMLQVPVGGRCTLYLDSSGGSVYGALAILTLLRLRKLQATGIVLGECSSAALLVFAGCHKRQVTPYSTLLFHRMRWQSDKRVGSVEATRWAQHFEALERDIDQLQARLFGRAEEQVRAWIAAGQYVSGQELAAAGLAELIDI
jgi:ATP-dependent protease ClpP protease subunit